MAVILIINMLGNTLNVVYFFYTDKHFPIKITSQIIDSSAVDHEQYELKIDNTCEA